MEAGGTRSGRERAFGQRVLDAASREQAGPRDPCPKRVALPLGDAPGSRHRLQPRAAGRGPHPDPERADAGLPAPRRGRTASWRRRPRRPAGRPPRAAGWRVLGLIGVRAPGCEGVRPRPPPTLVRAGSGRQQQTVLEHRVGKRLDVIGEGVVATVEGGCALAARKRRSPARGSRPARPAGRSGSPRRAPQRSCAAPRSRWSRRRRGLRRQDRADVGDRLDLEDAVGGGVLGQHLRLLTGTRVAHRQLDHEAVELGLGKRIGALVLRSGSGSRSPGRAAPTRAPARRR